MSLIAAISYNKVVSTQLMEGGVDSSVFENFIFHTLRAIRTDPKTADKTVLVLMDNTVIHHHSVVLQTLRKMKVNVLFNAQYSLWLIPIEHLFGLIKRQLKTKDINTK